MKPILPRRLPGGRHTKKPSAQAAQADALSHLPVAFILIVILFSILLTRFFCSQVTQHSELPGQASSNRITLILTPPVRGEIVDINDVPLTKSYPIFSLEVIPSRIESKMEGVIEVLREYVDITPTDLEHFKKYRKNYRKFENIPLKLRLTDEEAMRLSVHLREFKGVKVNSRTFRKYPYGKLTSHFLGYIGRINDKGKEIPEEEGLTALYRGSAHIGKSGLEKYYEHQLHDIPDYQEVEKDAYGNIVRILKNAPSKMGQTLRLGADIHMQQEADRIPGDRRGALVAINPRDGTALAFVSKPPFDPNPFIDGIDSDTWKMLNDDWKKPLINRVTQGLYFPGSTFKPFMGTALLESGKITQNTIVPAPGAQSIPGSRHIFRDSVRSGYGSANLSRAIQVSSDTPFYRLGYEMGIDKAPPYLAQFGFGQKTGIDLPNEYTDVLPSREWKAKRFVKFSDPTAKEWRASEMVSVSIGQGYNAYTPLQMAHAAASLANNGVVYQPHLVKEILDFGACKIARINPNPERQVSFKADNFEYVKRVMEKVLEPGGTAHRIGGGLAYTMDGKTDTTQVVQIKQGGRYDAAALREQRRNHVWFISFAPLEKPGIAIAVILENGGWGAYAAPLAREMTDFYMLHIKPQQFLDGLETDSAKTEKTDKHQPITNIFQFAYGLTLTNPAPQPEVHHE